MIAFRLLMLILILGGGSVVAGLAAYAIVASRRTRGENRDLKRKNETLVDVIEDEFFDPVTGLRVADEEALFSRRPLLRFDGELYDPFYSDEEYERMQRLSDGGGDEPKDDFFLDGITASKLQYYQGLFDKNLMTIEDIRSRLSEPAQQPAPEKRREAEQKLKEFLKPGVFDEKAAENLLNLSFNLGEELPNLIAVLEDNEKKHAEQAARAIDVIENRRGCLWEEEEAHALELHSATERYNRELEKRTEDYQLERAELAQDYYKRAEALNREIAEYRAQISGEVVLPEDDTVLNVSVLVGMMKAWESEYGAFVPSELEWYFTRPVIKKLCSVNGISRRQSHHQYAASLYSSEDLHLNEWLLERGLRYSHSGEIVDEWIQAGEQRGALAYPVRLFSIPIAYYFGTGIVMGEPHKGIVCMLAAREPVSINGTKQTLAIALEIDGTVSPLSIVSLPKIEKDLDGNPAFSGKRYLAPHTHEGHLIAIEDKLLDD